MSSFESKKSEALRLLRATGIQRWNYLPPFTRALWRLGFEVPPPHFIPFRKIAFFFGAYFACAWGALMYVLDLLWFGASPFGFLVLCVCSIMAGLLFGPCMAAYYAAGRHKHRLPRWETLGQAQGTADPA